MTAVSFTVPGTPVAKGRPRFTRQGRAYTPAKTVAYEAKVRSAYMGVTSGAFVGPLRLSVVAYFQFTASWPKSRKGSERYHTAKPDLDNIVKIVGDALNGYAFNDDSQIAFVSASKRVGPGEPRLSIILEELDDGA